MKSNEQTKTQNGDAQCNQTNEQTKTQSGDAQCNQTNKRKHTFSDPSFHYYIDSEHMRVTFKVKSKL